MARKVIIEHWACEKCGNKYITEESANKCCEPKFCKECNVEMPTKTYSSLCETCKEKVHYDKCNKMTYQEYCNKYPNNPLYIDEKYFYDIEDLIDYYEDGEIEIPKYVYGTECHTACIDIDYAIEHALEEAYEDAEFKDAGERELRRFIEEWNDEYGLKYFYDTDIVVILDDYRK